MSSFLSLSPDPYSPPTPPASPYESDNNQSDVYIPNTYSHWLNDWTYGCLIPLFRTVDVLAGVDLYRINGGDGLFVSATMRSKKKNVKYGAPDGLKKHWGEKSKVHNYFQKSERHEELVFMTKSFDLGNITQIIDKAVERKYLIQAERYGFMCIKVNVDLPLFAYYAYLLNPNGPTIGQFRIRQPQTYDMLIRGTLPPCEVVGAVLDEAILLKKLIEFAALHNAIKDDHIFSFFKNECRVSKLVARNIFNEAIQKGLLIEDCVSWFKIGDPNLVQGFLQSIAQNSFQNTDEELCDGCTSHSPNSDTVADRSIRNHSLEMSQSLKRSPKCNAIPSPKRNRDDLNSPVKYPLNRCSPDRISTQNRHFRSRSPSIALNRPSLLRNRDRSISPQSFVADDVPGYVGKHSLDVPVLDRTFSSTLNTFCGQSIGSMSILGSKNRDSFGQSKSSLYVDTDSPGRPVECALTPRILVAPLHPRLEIIQPSVCDPYEKIQIQRVNVDNSTSIQKSIPDACTAELDDQLQLNNKLLAILATLPGRNPAD